MQVLVVYLPSGFVEAPLSPDSAAREQAEALAANEGETMEGFGVVDVAPNGGLLDPDESLTPLGIAPN